MCVEKSTDFRSSWRIARQLVEQLAPEREVEAGGRLVHEEQVGVVRERDGQRELHLRPVRERLEALAERQAEPRGQAAEARVAPARVERRDGARRVARGVTSW